MFLFNILILGSLISCRGLLFFALKVRDAGSYVLPMPSLPLLNGFFMTLLLRHGSSSAAGSVTAFGFSSMVLSRKVLTSCTKDGEDSKS